MIDGRILLVNAELERMFGYPRANLVDRPIEALFPERFQSGHAMFRDGNANDFKPCAMGAGRELVGVRANGSEFSIEVGINALQTPNGVLVVETIVDITVRKRLERIFQKIVEAAPSGMIIVEPKGRIVLVNPQTEIMFGYSRMELIGNSLEMLLPERFRANRDLTARRKDGTEFAVEIGLNPVLGEEDGLVLAVVNDVTRRNTTQLSLRQANANLEEFADLVEWIGEDMGENASPAVTRNLGRVSDRIRRLDRGR